MELTLTLSNEKRVLPGVRAFTHETLQQMPLLGADRDDLEEIIFHAVQDAVEHAYPPGEEGTVQLTIRDTGGKLEVLVRDNGLPQDVAELERRLHAPGASPAMLLGGHRPDLVDEVHWLGYGPHGKALQIIKWLHATHITENAHAGTLEAFHDDAPLAPEQQYTIRRLRAEDAVHVSQLMYRAYGNTYFNPDVYYPERIAAQNSSGSLISIVAEGANGYIAGHSALERNQEGPVAESGQAVVDPAHRGRGLLDRMKPVLLEEARRLDLIGWYADAVAVHTRTQKSNVTHGGHLCGVDLGISPKTEQFRGITKELPQRLTCLLYFHWLKEPKPRNIHVPARHREIVAAIYENLQCPVRMREGAAPTDHGTLIVKLDAPAAAAFIRADLLGADSIYRIRHAKRDLIERSRAEALFVDLPLEDPATAVIAEELERDGFSFAAVAPHFSTRGDLLRLVYLVEPLQREPIKTYDEFAAKLVDYVLSEQHRVRNL